MVAIGMFEAKTHFSQLVDDLLEGKTDYISVMRRGKPVVRIVLEETKSKVKIGLSKGKWKSRSWEEEKSLDNEVEAMFDENIVPRKAGK